MLKQITCLCAGAFPANLSTAGPVTFRGLLLLAMLLTGNALQAAESTVYKQTADQTMEQVYPAVYKALEEAKFFVVFEPKISKMLSRFSEKWGEDYNQNKLSSIRSMVFCNGWYANAVSNVDPDMLALCPLRIGLYEKQGKTTVVFARPTAIGAQSAAKSVLKALEEEVINAINAGMKAGEG
ncbi:hypothetical protein MNBD_GAMMA11-1951 [hydrothermal vent metagenome]|uniref:DUF302 domain-containing protein n=1 Tax=hydrothermal vent metagenome TaxID=652676 RepID=A0A3B0WUZ0_9ZZZZ